MSFDLIFRTFDEKNSMVYWKRVRNEHKENLTKGAEWELVRRARKMRKNGTEAEDILWDLLRNRRLGVKFRRQHPLGHFIADLYCHEIGLVVELDGSHHEDEDQKERDLDRSTEMNKMGIRVIRFRNEDVLSHPDRVLRTILEEVEKRK
jgi:very-short-patch-repair endonuclease